MYCRLDNPMMGGTGMPWRTIQARQIFITKVYRVQLTTDGNVKYTTPDTIYYVLTDFNV